DIDADGDVVGNALLLVALVVAVVVPTDESRDANGAGRAVTDLHVAGRNVDHHATGTAPRGGRGERVRDLIIPERDRGAEQKGGGENVVHVAPLRLGSGKVRRP